MRSDALAPVAQATVRFPGASNSQGLLTVVWGLLFFNVLPFYELPTLIEVPSSIGRLLTQGSLILALGLALALNPRICVRPNIFLLLLSLVGILGLMTAPHNEFFLGSSYRAVRFLMVLAVLWLLTPAWGRADAPLMRAHMSVLGMVLGSVVLGLIAAPSAALSFDGRLSGAIWPMPPTQVAHYAAVLLGLVAIHWLTRQISLAVTLPAMAISGAVLLATHTRTSMAALLAGLAIAVLSLFLGHARVRRVSIVTLIVGFIGTIVFAPVIGAWLLRDQSIEEASALTGRTLVWSRVIELPRGFLETLVGSGPSNASFDGLPIDSNWVASYLDQGLVGVTIQVLVLVTFLVTSAVRPRTHQRAAALFLVGYFVVASFTETGLNAPSTYLLDMTVAAALLARPAGFAPANTAPSPGRGHGIGRMHE